MRLSQVGGNASTVLRRSHSSVALFWPPILSVCLCRRAQHNTWSGRGYVQRLHALKLKRDVHVLCPDQQRGLSRQLYGNT